MPRKPARAPRTRRELTRVAVTERAGEPAHPVAAVSEDGVWDYAEVRSSLGGVSWAITHVPTGILVQPRRNLTDARATTADGRAARDVERVLQHRDGKHAERRDMLCLSC